MTGVKSYRHILAALALAARAGYARAAAVQSPLEPASVQAEKLATLSWALIYSASLIFVLVIAIGLFGLWRTRGGADRTLSGRASRNLVLFGGVVIPALVLFSLVAGSVWVGSVVSGPEQATAMTVEVRGQLWWWEVRYLGRDGRLIASTANEIHLPAGEPVKFVLRSHNVIHSFWVPRLQGKIDLIPGRTNTLWMRATEPGIYRGQCAEFCGQQHAHMAFLVIVQPPERFAQWLEHQAQPALEPTTPSAIRGRHVFLTSACAACHMIRGTPALATFGPELTHLASRLTIAAGTRPNARGHLAGWILDPQSTKPGAFMPPTALPPHELEALLDYLESLE